VLRRNVLNAPSCPHDDPQPIQSAGGRGEGLGWKTIDHYIAARLLPVCSSKRLEIFGYFWSEWQDLRVRSFAIEISCVFQLSRLFCVLTLCTRKRLQLSCS
jgi:hypothetical protein